MTQNAYEHNAETPVFTFVRTRVIAISTPHQV